MINEIRKMLEELGVNYGILFSQEECSIIRGKKGVLVMVNQTCENHVCKFITDWKKLFIDK